MNQSQRPPIRGMKPNHGCETPSSLVFVDVETQQDVITKKPLRSIQRFRLGCATYIRYDRGTISRRDQIDFTSSIDFWNWLEGKQQQSKPLWVYGHNLGFDLTQLRFWELLQLGEYRVKTVTPNESNGQLSGAKSWRGKLVIDGFPFFVYAMGSKGKVKFVDSMNLFPYSLAKLGEELGFPKGKWPGFDCSNEELFPYCRQDVNVLERAITRTLDEWIATDGGNWQPTAAMLAITSFRHKLPKKTHHSKDRTIVLDDKDDWVPLERAAYYGGQTTCFYIGAVLPIDHESNQTSAVLNDTERRKPTGPIWLLDVRSLYPSVMRDGKFPFRRLFRRKSMDVRELRRTMESYGAVAHVRISDAQNEYTVRRDGRQYQVTGDYKTELAGPELLRALDAGSVVRIYDAQIYCMDCLFRDWVDDWYARRLEAIRAGDQFQVAFCKMILNSLSGKFAQQSDIWQDEPKKVPLVDWGYWYEIDADTGERRSWRSVGGNAQIHTPAPDPWYTFPAISAYITSMGREHMRWLRSLCPAGSVLYQATDSLMVTRDGYYALHEAGLIRENELGYLSVKTVAEYGEILGVNHYRLGEEWVRSGSWGRAVRGEDGRFWYQSFEGVKSIIARQPDGSIRVDEHLLGSIGEYQKGTKDDAGWTSFPVLGGEKVPF